MQHVYEGRASGFAVCSTSYVGAYDNAKHIPVLHALPCAHKLSSLAIMLMHFVS